MKNGLFQALIFIHLLFAASAFSQTVKPTPPPADDNDVVKISTSLVQVDAVVTDKNGNAVTNLTSADFEILQDGKPQKISNVSYVNRTANQETSSQTLVSQKKIDKNTPLPPPSSGRSTEFGRILTFIVDDGNSAATQLGMIAAKEGLEKFVNEQMLPDDSVAIYQTRGGSSLFQQYTSDKSLLLQIIKKIRWYPPNGIGGNSAGSNYEPIQNNANETQANADQREALEDKLSDRQVSGLFGVARYAINGLKQTGGRKLLFIMSDSVPLLVGSRQNQQLTRTAEAAKDLVETANRAAVVINTIDVRGLYNPMLDASDDPEGLARSTGATTTNMLTRRDTQDNQRRGGLAYIANETGGKFYENANFLNVPIEKALKLEKGYYLIGYQPEEETFQGKTFHKIEIKVKNPDFKTSSRSGFIGITDDELRPKQRTKTADSELYEALVAPLKNADMMNIRLSAYFANNPLKGNFIHAIMYIDGKDITFADGANGNKKAVFDIVAVTLDDKNKVVDDSNSTRTIQVPQENVEEVKKSGLVYTVDVPVKKEGVYTFRTAIREATDKRIGSSSQVIEVPDLKKDKVFLSGLIVSGVDATGQMYVFEGEKTENVFSTVVSRSVPAVRQFQRNSVVSYAYTIYNAKIDSATSKPKLTIQTKLFRDGKVFSEGTPQPADIGIQTDLTRIRDFAYMRLNADVPIGDYALQVIVKDLQTNQITSQWIDFEVIN